jgi:undecaprenyl-diphosphatase
VGFASLNGSFHRLTGVHMALYTLTDWLSLLPVALGAGFAALGAVQWIRRRRIGQVDRDLLALGGFYLLVLAVYLAFECFVVNRRPVLIGGIHEASYPSSTTVLVLCVGSTAVMQLKSRICHQGIRRWVCTVLIHYMAAMVLGRLLSGVHWLSDIIGGVFISGALVTLYGAVGDN